MKWLARALAALMGLVVLAGASGCASAVSAGTNTALDGMDLVAMTEQMAASIAASPAVREQIAAGGPMKVVVLPVQNYMTGEVLPQGQARMFTARVRSLLAARSQGDFVWITNRDAFYGLRAEELAGVDLGPSPEAVDPDFALQARFDSLANVSFAGRSSSYLCVFELTNIRTRQLLWTDKYEVRRTAVRRWLD